MKMRRRTLLLAALAARPAEAACALPAATVPVRTLRGIGVVEVALNGQSAPMVLDTGAERSVLTPAAVEQYRLPLDEWVGSSMRGADGRIGENRNANLARVTLGGAPLVPRAGRISLPVVSAMDIGGLAGLLGADLLRGYDLDLDLPAGQLSLFKAGDCRGAPWTQRSERIPLRLLRNTDLLVPIRLEGVALTSLLDTGAGTSLINARGLHRLGLTPDRLRSDAPALSQAIGGAFPARRHVFGKLELGSAAFTDVPMLEAMVVEPAFDLLLGFDVLSRLRVWISYASGHLSIAQR